MFLSASLLFCPTIMGCTSSGDLLGSNTGLLLFELELNPNAAQVRQDTYTAILLQQDGEPIEPSNAGTYTDFIRIYDNQAVWYHRQSVVGQAVLEFVPVADVSNVLSKPDAQTVRLTFDMSDAASVFNQYMLQNDFTTHAVTTDQDGGGVLGRLLDTLGTELYGSSNYTVYANKSNGAVTPFSPTYPVDDLGDQFEPSGSGLSNPFDADIIRFEVVNNS